MPTRPSRALALVATAVLLALAALVGGGSSAVAAPDKACSDLSVGMQSRQASAVFTGTVTGVKTEDMPDGQPGVRLVHTVEVDQVYKAAQVTVAAEVEVVTTRNARDTCNLGRLSPDDDYVFFVRGDADDSAQPFTASGDGGTAPQRAALLHQVEAIFPHPVDPSPAEKSGATITRLDTTPPTALSRAAAPGAAMVVIGLLGLVVVRRASRRA